MALKALLVGSVISGVLHLHFEMRWAWYSAAISEARLEQMGGVPPAPFALSSARSAATYLVAYFLFAVMAILLFRHPWYFLGGGVAGAALSTFALWCRVNDGPGNLWPFTLVIILAVTAIPVAAGTGVGFAILRILRR